MATRRVQRPAVEQVKNTPITEGDVRASLEKIRAYADPYRELFYMAKQGQHMVEMIEGMTSGLERKSVEPIAVMHGLDRHTLQYFVGQSRWQWKPLKEQQWAEVSEEIGTPDGSLVIDGSSTEKKGEDTVGVARQWCGHAGKVDNCVVGVYAVLVGLNEAASLVDSELFLPKEWVDDKERRAAAHVPEAAAYRTQPDIAMAMIRRLSKELPFEWVLADDEFGRRQTLRDTVAGLGKSYVLDVPMNTNVQRLRASGQVRKKVWTARELTKSLPKKVWEEFQVRDGEKGPINVRAVMVPIVTARTKGRRVSETLLVVETVAGDERWYCLAKAKPGTTLLEYVRRAGMRHRVEEVFQECKGEVGLDHYEVRAWHGWYHHMTLSQIAHWFLVREKRRLGGKITWPDREHDSNDPRASPATLADPRKGCNTGELPQEAQRRGARRSVPSTRPPAAFRAPDLGIPRPSSC